MPSPFLSPSSRSATDPLSDVLSLLKPKNYMSGGIDCGGEWSFYFRELDVTRCYAQITGESWLQVDGQSEPIRLLANDCVLMPHSHGFRLASDLALDPVDAMQVIIAQPMNGRIIAWNGGGGSVGISSIFSFTGDHAGLLLNALPNLIHLRDRSEQATMHWCLQRMMRELSEPQPGDFLMGQHLAHMLLVEALRLYLSDEASRGVGWLFALSDKQMLAAMNAIHEDPAHAWNLQELAGRANMSRSKFALHFKERVGMSPIEYLTHWRMLRAQICLPTPPRAFPTSHWRLGTSRKARSGPPLKRLQAFLHASIARTVQHRTCSSAVCP